MKNLVTMGGGTGGYTVLSGIKNIPDVSISAVVAMTDDGGSTGVLRDELGVLPPGDARQCLIALSEQTDIVRKLMSYRFEDGGLAGHNFGNILLAGLEKVTGSFVGGIEVASDILKVKGKVIPVTDRTAILEALLTNGITLRGENEINHTNLEGVGVKRLIVNNDAVINEHARNAILEADLVIIGPGNHYCSVLPNLVVKGCKEALQVTKGKILYIVNLTNKKGHTLTWNAKAYVDDIESHLGRKLDYILINNEAPSQEQIEAYKLMEGDGVLIENDLGNDTRVIEASIISKNITPVNKADKISHVRSFIRHDSTLLKKEIEKIVYEITI